MKNLLVFLFMIVSFAAIAQDVPAEGKDWFKEAGIWIGLLILIWEYIVGKTDYVKSNSTIEMAISFVKNLFGKK
jgi:hypothetical protein